MDAVVLAGGVEKGELAAETGVENRALLEVGGRTMIRRVLAALRGASEVDRVALVGPPAVQAAVPDEAVDFRVDDAGSLVANVTSGVEATAPGTEQVLLLTCDLPFLTPTAVDDVIRQSMASRAAVTYSIIPKESSERRFPGGRRLYVRLREGEFTGGNVMVLTRAFVRERQALIQHLYESRKNPVRLATLLGVRFIVGLLTHRLTLPDLEAKASQIAGGRVAAIVSTYAEVGFDIDKVEDLHLARRMADTVDRG